MPTLAGLRRRGVPPAAIRDFVKRIGVAKANSVVDVGMLEFSIREVLNKTALRRMAVLRPLKVVIENYPEGQSEELDAVNHPGRSGRRHAARSASAASSTSSATTSWRTRRRSSSGSRPAREVRLRYAYFVTCREVVKDAAGEVVELRCTYDPATRGGNAPDGRKVQGDDALGVGGRRRAGRGAALQSAVHQARPGRRRTSPPISIRNSLEVLTDARLEPALAAGTIAASRCSSSGRAISCAIRTPQPDRPVFNRTVGLRDTFAKEVGGKG